MPKWPFANGPTGCMIGAHAVTVLADWLVKEANISKSDIEVVMSYMLRNANNNTKHDSRSQPQKYI
jgi:putative alpha-1,2-mannosidase